MKLLFYVSDSCKCMGKYRDCVGDIEFQFLTRITTLTA